MEFFDQTQLVPFVSLFEVLDKAFSTLQVENMKAVPHEDTEYNDDYSVDPLADPRLDKMDLFNMVDTKHRDAIMSAQASFDYAPSPDVEDSGVSNSEAPSASGPGE